MIHVVFQENDIDTLKKAIELDETLQGDVIQIKDDYAVGPLKDIYEEEGIQTRKQWWRDVLSGGDYDGIVDDGSVADDNKMLSDLIIRLTSNNDEEVWIWAAPNKHDVSGYYWLISLLKDFEGRILILYLNNLPFINDKGSIFYPQNIFNIPPKEFLKAKKLARAITPGEFEVDADEWNKLTYENRGVRTLEGGKKLIQYDYDYYDNDLLAFITPDWQKVNKLFHTFFSKSKNITGDAYLLWRLKLMIAEGKIDAQGEIKRMKDFEVKSKENVQ
ncbi:MAG: DUF1835 domain-containing protein [Ginsengibacter sp.]